MAWVGLGGAYDSPGVLVTLAVAANRPTDIPENQAMTTVTALPTDPVLPLRQGFERMRSAFRSDMAPSLAARRDRLDRLARMTRRHAQDIIGTISADFPDDGGSLFSVRLPSVAHPRA